MANLVRFNKYSRKEIHDIFSPNTSFTPGAGLWGLWGIVKIPDTVSDYIFYVTYGHSESGHDFDESIDENGILTWQSQPRQTLADDKIIDLITHDYTKSNIYLFLRTSNKEDYTYLGNLAYVSHDNTREKPVYFKWQILDWDPSKQIDLSLDTKIIKRAKKRIEDIIPSNVKINIIEFENQLMASKRNGLSTDEFNKKNIDFEGNAAKNSALGKIGEDIIIEYEKQTLRSAGREDLAKQVCATRNIFGNAASFDVLSYDIDGNKKYIEVKTTKGSITNSFYISENEVLFSEKYRNNYYLYRLFNFNIQAEEVDLSIVKGALSRKFLTPTNYVCRLCKNI